MRLILSYLLWYLSCVQLNSTFHRKCILCVWLCSDLQYYMYALSSVSSMQLTVLYKRACSQSIFMSDYSHRLNITTYFLNLLSIWCKVCGQKDDEKLASLSSGELSGGYWDDNSAYFNNCNFREDEHSKQPYTLHCQMCDNVTSSCFTGSSGVDPTLVSRFLGLLRHPDTAVVVAVVEALPTVVMHTTISSIMVSQYLTLLTHRDKAVVSALCQQLPALVCVKEQHLSQVCWYDICVLASSRKNV